MRVLRWLSIAACVSLGTGCSGGDDDDDDDGTFADPLDGEWLAGFALPGASGFGAQVFTALVTSDGTIVGGTFSEVGGMPAANVARFDGGAWTALGTALPEGVRALALDSAGTLIAGGDFASLYAFDGAEWVARPGAISGSVNAIAAQNGGLVVGGSFDDAGGSGAASLARYDEGVWSAAGGDVIGTVKAIKVVDADTLCIGGSFSDVGAVTAANVACEDGGVWTQLGDGLPGEASVLVRDGAGDWIAGGTLTFVIDPMTGEYEAGLAKLEAGTWEPLAGGIDNGFINDVRAIHVRTDGELIVGGTFETAGTLDVPASNIARLSGGTWSEVGGGVDNLVGVFIGSAIGVNVIVPHGDGGLLAGGVFSHAANGVATNVAIADSELADLGATVPESNSILGVSGFVDAIAFHPEGSMIVGGSFSGVGHLPVANIARYAEGTWTALGQGIDDGLVRAIAILEDGTIIAGGDFASLRRYHDMQWEPYAPGVQNVFALLVDDGGALYAAGDFDEFVKRWNGSEWESLDGGLDARPASLTFDDRGRLVAGGLFSTGSGIALNGIGRFSGGSWHDFDGGLTNGGYVSDVAFLENGDMVVVGAFDEVGGVAASSIARFSDGSWEEIAEFPVLVDIEPYGDGFFVTGIFEDLPGGQPAGYLAWYDGEEFHALGEGLSDLAEEIHVNGTRLWCGGTFVKAGGRVSSGIAAWSFTPGP